MKRVWLALLISGLSACAPALNDGGSGARGRVTLLFDKDPEPRNSSLRGLTGNQLREEGSALASSNGNVTLPNDYCYVIHVTAPDLEQVAPGADLCGPLSGLGLVTAKAYNKGDTAEIEVRIGQQRRFELLAMKSPLGEKDGRAVCGDFSANFNKGENALKSRIVYKIQGQVVTSKPVMVAQVESDVNPGDNVITMKAVPLVKADVTTTFGLDFGAPYMRADHPATASYACSGQVFKVAQAFVTSGAGTKNPIASDNASGRYMRAVSSLPVLHDKDPIESSTTGSDATLATGILNLER